MVVVDDLLQRSHCHRRTTQIIDFRPLVLVLLLSRRLRLQTFLVLDELFLEDEVVLDTLNLEETQTTSGARIDGRQLGRR